MPYINNILDLDKILSQKTIKAMELTRDEIFEIVSRKVYDYYNEPVFKGNNPAEPAYYNRGHAKMSLMDSLTASHIKQENGRYSFTVGFDDDYLTFRYPEGFVKKNSSGWHNGITGEEVLETFNSGSHGYTVKGSHNYWNEALSEIESKGGVSLMFKRNLKKLGISIK